MYVYAVRKKGTEDFANKYDSNRYYVRQGDATRRAKNWNSYDRRYRQATEDTWEVVRSELKWETF